MSRLRLYLLVLVTTVSSAYAGPITGVFQGTVIQLPAAKAQAKTRWMYVQGKNGAIRRANIAHAIIEYDEDYPQAKRHRRPEESLRKTTVVRVTAQQDEAKDGEWQATNVLIVAPPGTEKPKSQPLVVIPSLAKR